jgi:predicted ATP-binding protein involved in virulence
VSAGLHAWDEMLDVFFPGEDRVKIEWAVGSLLSDGPKKTMILTGNPATGKSTVLHIIQKIFDKNKPNLRVKVQHDGYVKNAAFDGSKHLFFADNRAPKIVDAIMVESSGNTIPFKKYKAFAEAAEAAHAEIAKQCVRMYETLGANYYDKQENN